MALINNFEISKTLTEYDVTEKVGLPVRIVEHMNPVMMNREHSVELMAFDRWGQQWPLKYYTRPTRNGRNPVLTAGWRQLVEANGVLAGDKLIFSRHQDAGEMQYRIQVIRRTNTSEGETVDVEVMKTVQREPVNYLKN